MQWGLTREITKEQHDRAVNNRGYITKEDAEEIFTPAELCGYDVCSAIAAKVDEKYIVRYALGDTCD